MKKSKYADGPPKIGRRSVKFPEKITFDIVNQKYMGSVEAAEIANVSKGTIEHWCNKYGIGKQIEGRYQIDIEKFNTFMQKDDRQLIHKKLEEDGSIRYAKCPHGYRFGFDFDEKEKCIKCVQLIWLYCGRKSDRLHFVEKALMRKNKLFTKKGLQKRIEEMESRL